MYSFFFQYASTFFSILLNLVAVFEKNASFHLFAEWLTVFVDLLKPKRQPESRIKKTCTQVSTQEQNITNLRKSKTILSFLSCFWNETTKVARI